MTKKALIIVFLASFLVLGLVFALYFGFNFHSWRPQNPFLLPKINAIINSLTTLMLISGFIAIKYKRQGLHRFFMMSAFILSALFLTLYTAYHSLGIHVVFADLNADGKLSLIEKDTVGGLRYLYYTLLSSHIILSMAILPLVLLTFYTALTNKFSLHKKITKFSLPLWLYVTVSGVLVYLMIQPYYAYITIH